eukprot:scaffold66405_cov46-Phaeocystis_antarctica.AAC.1
MLSDDKGTSPDSMQQLARPFQTPKSESENKRHQRACSSSFGRPFQTPKSESENKRHHRACSSSFARPFQTPKSESEKIIYTATAGRIVGRGV